MGPGAEAGEQPGWALTAGDQKQGARGAPSPSPALGMGRGVANSLSCYRFEKFFFVLGHSKKKQNVC